MLTGWNISAASKSKVSPTRTTITARVNGINFSISYGCGRGSPFRLARHLRTPSITAIAMCPPSIGRSGNKLNIPTKIFKLAMIIKKVVNLSRHFIFGSLAVCALTLATPTTPTSPFGSRFCFPKVCLTKAGILVGSENSEVTELTATSFVIIALSRIVAIGFSRLVPKAFTIPINP